MKIALVCGHFVPGMGYVEVYFAKEMAKKGHNVQVFTSAVVPAYVRNVTSNQYQVGTTEADGYQINRLPHQFSVGQMIRPKGLTKAVDNFNPDLIMVIGLGKLFPESVFKLSAKYKIVTLLGDNADNHESVNAKPLLDNIKQSLKKRVYKKGVKASSKLFSYTPESIGIVSKFVGGNLGSLAAGKNVDFSLGFDAEKFFFSDTERASIRSKYSIDENDSVLITATRIIPHKRLETIIDHVDELNLAGKKLKYVLIGFFDDAYSKEVKSYIRSKPSVDQFICLPFMNFEEVRAHYNAADFAYFPTAVISIFEAMGTGLPVILPHRKSVSHIIRTTNGQYCDLNSSDFKSSYDRLISGGFGSRQELIDLNREHFSYTALVQFVLDNC